MSYPMATVIRRNNIFYNKGFTLIELLVVTAVVGVLGVLCETLISSILRSQNKTAIITEVRQNGDLVISKFERDVKQSESVTSLAPVKGVTLGLYDGTNVNWICDPSAGSFERGAGLSVINTNSDNGVKVTACSFAVTPPTHTSGVTQIVTLTFTLEQRSTVQSAEYQVSEQFETTVGTRAY